VDVLPRQQYEDEHIAGAISIPLGRLAEEASRLRRDRPVIVYCYDSQ
jgi:rhodanese-related sulfurtransferase